MVPRDPGIRADTTLPSLAFLSFSVRNYNGSWNDWSEKYKPSREEEDDD